MVEPLKSKTMTLRELQAATLKLIRATRKHLRKKAWESGMTDDEFESTILYNLEATIKADQDALKMACKKGGE